MSYAKRRGFTLVELLIVIIIIGILSALFIPRYWEVARQARISTLEGIASAMRSAVNITRVNALAQGITPADSNPGAGQSAFVVQMEGFQAEVDWRNLCPESEAEFGDNATMLDYINLERKEWVANQEVTGELFADTNNQFTWVGYNIKDNGSAGGCYIRYDSFGNPECTIELITTDC